MYFCALWIVSFICHQHLPFFSTWQINITHSRHCSNITSSVISSLLSICTGRIFIASGLSNTHCAYVDCSIYCIILRTSLTNLGGFQENVFLKSLMSNSIWHTEKPLIKHLLNLWVDGSREVSQNGIQVWFWRLSGGKAFQDGRVGCDKSRKYRDILEQWTQI